MEKHELATFGGGCFWCLEAVFERLAGVIAVESGYAGGEMENPSYHEVCRGTTGHAEVVRITFDPEAIPYPALLEVFFEIHDPTTLNRQGNDVGTQYRSVIFYHSEQQRRAAEEAIRALRFSNPVVTELAPASTFYPAESYHQRYFENNPGQPYCLMVVSPKVAKFRKKFADRLK